MVEILYDNRANSVNSLSEELFIPILNYPKYGVNKKGLIKNLIRNKILQYNILKNGYARVDLTNEFGIKHHSVHRIVALTFIYNEFNKPYVNHKDGNKINNHVSNLEWVTELENSIHAVNSGLTKVAEDHFLSKLSNNIVRIVPVMTLLGGSRRSIAESLNVSKTTIAKILNRTGYSSVNINIDLSNTYLPRGKKGKIFTKEEINYLLENTELTL